MSDAPAFGRRVKQLRGLLDLTQEALAERVGCATQTIRKIERAERRPSRQMAERLAQVLEVAPDERAAFLKAARAEADADATPAEETPQPAQPTPVPALPTGTVTFLFADIEDSARLWEEHPSAMPHARARYDALMRRAIGEHGGVIFRTLGDAFCVAFARAPDALATALAAQRVLHREPWGATGPLGLRIALHTDAVDLRDGDYLGLPLSRVARLLAACHGGQTLLSRTTRDLVADRLPSDAALRDLGAYRLKDLSRLEQIFQLVVADLPDAFPPLHALDPRPTHLPVPPAPLIGRADERAEIARRFADSACRLLTLVGPGGVGKTRLALQVAIDYAEVFAQGAHFVPLAPVSSAELLVPAIADALNFTFYGSADPKTQLLAYLRDKELLLVLDNFEHLLDGIGLLSELMQRAPGVKLLATSRERLNVQDEWVIELQGLPVTKSASAGSDSSGAVALFVRQARQAQTDFRPSEQDRESIVRICQLLDGLPLGIELAAAWVRMLSCEEIAQEIERNLDFLSAPARDVPARHRSLRAVFDHSWLLLAESERLALRRLSVFRAGFGRVAAAQVAGASLPLLATLVDKSLLRRSTAGRYDMHELVRQYGAIQLQADSPDYDATRDRHCAYYTAWLQEREAGLKSADQKAIVAEISAEIDNVRLAWDWMIARYKTAEIGAAARGLFRFYESQCWYQEGESAFQRAASQLDEARGVAHERQAEHDAALGKVLTYQAYFCFRTSQHGRARELLRRSLDLLTPLDERPALADTLSWLGIVSYHMGDYADARRLLDQSLMLSRAGGYRWNSAINLSMLGTIAHTFGEDRQAHELLRESLAIWRVLGDSRGTGFCLNYLSVVARTLGEYREAQCLLQESLTMSSAVGDRSVIGAALNELGLVAHALEEYQEARYMFRESLALFREMGDRWYMTQALVNLGAATAALGDDAEAQQIFRDAFAIAMEAQIVPVALDALVGLAKLWVKAGAVEPAIELLEHVLRHPAIGRATQASAAQLCDALERDLPAQRLRAIREHALARSFDELTAELLSVDSQLLAITAR